MTSSYVDKILKSHVYDVAKCTPLTIAKGLSKRFGNVIYMKREDFQTVFSFKCRGAHNKISSLSVKDKKKGVIAASAGNHAQGVALSAQYLGIKAVIVMPNTTPEIKVDAVKQLGAKAILVGDSYDDAYEYAVRMGKEKGYSFIHPYDDPDVIAGQGTIGMEILNQLQDPIHSIFVAVGGGGLLAGIVAYVKHVRPDIKVIGVEPDNSACLFEALKAGRRVTLSQVGIFADGVAVKQIGKEPFRVVKSLVDDVVLVSTDEICAAIKDIYDESRSIVEPAGALSLAGLKKYCESKSIKNQNLVTINCGANMNFDRLRHIAERAEIGEHREALLCVTIPEKPGSFLKFCKLLGKRKSISEFNYRYSNQEEARIFVGIELKEGLKERDQLIKLLEKGGYSVVDLTENEMAKIHVRHMVGGRVPEIKDERLYRFQFPERPGALLEFLKSMESCWNISLFHYRNHGAAFGRVLVGIQVSKKEESAFRLFLDRLGYTFFNETDNLSYTLFLK